MTGRTSQPAQHPAVPLANGLDTPAQCVLVAQ